MTLLQKQKGFRTDYKTPKLLLLYSLIKEHRHEKTLSDFRLAEMIGKLRNELK